MERWGSWLGRRRLLLGEAFGSTTVNCHGGDLGSAVRLLSP